MRAPSKATITAIHQMNEHKPRTHLRLVYSAPEPVIITINALDAAYIERLLRAVSFLMPRRCLVLPFKRPDKRLLPPANSEIARPLG